MKIYVLVNEENLLVAEKFEQFELENKEGFKTLIKRPCLTNDVYYAQEFRTKLGANLYRAYILCGILGRLRVMELNEYRREIEFEYQIKGFNKQIDYLENLLCEKNKEIEKLEQKIAELSKIKKTRKI